MPPEPASGEQDPLSKVYLRKSSYTAFQLYHASPQCVYRDTRSVFIGKVPPNLMRERTMWKAFQRSADRVKRRIRTEFEDDAFATGVVETIADGEVWVEPERLRETHRNIPRVTKRPRHKLKHRKTFAERNIQISNSVDPVPISVSLDTPTPADSAIVSAIQQLSHDETCKTPAKDTEVLHLSSNEPSSASDHFGPSVISTPPSPLESPASSINSSPPAKRQQNLAKEIAEIPLETKSSVISSASFHTTRTSFEADSAPPSLHRVVSEIPQVLRSDPNDKAAITRTRSHSAVASPVPCLEKASTPCDEQFCFEDPRGGSPEVNEEVQQLVAPLLNLNGSELPAAVAENGNYRRVLNRFMHKKRGEVLFHRRFLMQIREVHRCCDENVVLDEFSAESKLADRWKEYTVVARHTGDPEAPVALYFYKGLEADKLERRIKHKWSRSFRFKLLLTSEWRAGIYSPVDIAVGLWRTQVVEEDESPNIVSAGFQSNSGKDTKEYKKRNVTTIYVFKAQTSDTVASFLVFLYIALRYDLKRGPLNVHVSDFNLTIKIPPTLMIEAAQSVLTQRKHEVVSYREVLGANSSPAVVTQSILEYIYAMLRRLELYKDVSELPDKMALAWRRFDRLLWINDRSDVDLLQSWAMEISFDLEYLPEYTESRPLPMCLGSEGGTILYEPTPVEGFCTRLSQWSGRPRRQQLANVTYLHSHGQFLAFSSPTSARPPLPLVDGKVPAPSPEAFEALPEVWEVAPYKLNESGHIDWIMKSRSLKEFDIYDTYAEFERARRAALLAECDGLLDMTTIDKVIESQKSETEFSIVFISGKSVRFTVATTELRSVWLKHLNDLVLYWKLRKESDAMRQRAYYRYNVARLAADHDEGMLRASAKSQLDLAMADSYTFSASQLLRNRSVVHADFLYMKDHQYTSFRKHFAILTFTDLILFQIKLDRTQHFSSNQQIYYRRYRKIPMKNAYFYTGLLAKDHLMDRDRYFDLSNPGVKALPRAFANGWTSQDTEIDRCLVLWSSSVKINTKDTEKKHAKVFLADSRYRRDRWATAIHHVLGNARVATAEN